MTAWDATVTRDRIFAEHAISVLARLVAVA